MFTTSLPVTKSSQYAGEIMKYEKHQVGGGQHITEPAMYMHYRFEDNCNSGKVLVKEVGRSNNVISGKEREILQPW